MDMDFISTQSKASLFHQHPWWWLGALFFLASCQQPAPLLPCPEAISVKTDRLPLYQKPQSESPLLGAARAGEVLCRTSLPPRLSDPTDKYCGLWLEVYTPDSLSAWIRLDSSSLKPPAAYAYFGHWLPELYTEALLPSDQHQWLPAYQQWWQQKELSQADWVRAYELANQLRQIAREAALSTPCLQLPCAGRYPTWPGLWFAPSADGCQPGLDFRQWQQLAQRTPPLQDDAFVQLWLSVYPTDSIGIGYPAWLFPTSPTQVYSLLGRGVHLAVLKQIDALWQQAPQLQPPLETLKAELLNDITSAQTVYWEDQSRILVEMDSLNQYKWVILSQADRVALEVRTRQLANPAAHGIQLNFRAGWHELNAE